MDTFQALAEPNRRKIIELLAQHGSLTASDIHKKFDATPPAISQHLKVLREARLVDVEKQAQRRIYRINADSLNELGTWAEKMVKLWRQRFDRLDKVLAELKEK
jgi:DNA-binding transcriptional ArsR family regulator